MATITRYRVRTANKDDYNAYKRVPFKTKSMSDYMIENFGNHQSMEGLKRERCHVCGKLGLECLGHPMTLDLGPTNTHMLSEFGYSTLKKLASLFCWNCKQFVSINPAKEQDIGELKNLSEVLALNPASFVCGCVGLNYQKYKFDIPKIPTKNKRRTPAERTKMIEEKVEEGKRPLLDQKVVDDLYVIAQATSESEFIQRFINSENVKNFFYDKYIMLPTMLHVKFTDNGLSNKIHTQTEMIKIYGDLIRYVIESNGKNVDNVRKIIRDLTSTNSESKYLGTPSHMKIANGKEGIYRDFAQNPRAWNTTRAVLTDGADRSGVMQCPINIMQNMYYTYVVSAHNIEWLQHKVIKGVVTRLVTTRDSTSTNKTYDYVPLTPKFKLKIGDVVIKQVENGDKIIVNRHPTLWKHSMIGYRVALWDKPCFGMNETNTKGHNADFDGDEGNAQVPHSTTGRIEASMIQAQYNIFGSHNGDPVITILYNGIIGMYELSRDTDIDENLFKHLISIVEARRFKKQSLYIHDIENGEQLIEKYGDRALSAGEGFGKHSGRVLISMLFPETLCYKNGDVEIKDGFLSKGFLKSKDISYEIVKAISLIDLFNAPYRLIDVGFQLASEYISAKGMMISANDYLAPGPSNDAGQEHDHPSFKKRLAELKKDDQYDERGPYAAKLDRLRGVDRSNMSAREFWTNLDEVDRKNLYDRSSIMPDGFAEDLAQLNVKIIELEEIKAGQTQASAERTEQVIVNEISDFTSKYEKLLKNGTFNERNISKISFMSGARGNIGQVMGAVSFVGQQYTDVDRLGVGVRRLSFYSQPDSKTIFDKGFVKNSFADGLSPHEVMMLAGPARRAAFKTYLGTPESGHISRQTILHTCGMKVNNHFSTEDRTGAFIETLYGYGCDASYVSKRKSLFGSTESCADPVAILNALNAKRRLANQ